jgi:ribose-phosphate pyrophosphokinase
VAKISASSLESLIVSNTIPLNDTSKSCSKITSLSVAELFGEAIRRIHEGSSVSSLFE